MKRRLVLLALLAGGWLPLRPIVAQQDGAAERLLIEAQRLERSGKGDDARTEYELLVQRFPDAPEAEVAQLALAEAYWRANESAKASAILDSLIDGKPDSPNAAAAWVLRGRFQVESAATREQLADARTPFRRVPVLFGSGEYPQLGPRVEARVRSGEASLMLAEPDHAALDFLEAIEDENASRWLPRARYGFSRSLLQLGERGAGADMLQRVLDDPDSDQNLRREASDWLALLERHWVRPANGQPRWSTVRPIGGIELKKPEKLAVSADGRVLVYDDGQSLVIQLDADHQLAGRSSQSQVRDLWWSPAGRPYVALQDAVIALDDGSRQTLAVGGAPLKDLSSGASGLLGERYVVDRDRKALYVVDRKGDTKTLSSAASDVVDLAVGVHGELLVVDRKKTEIARIGGLAAEPAKGISGSWRRPQAVAVDAAGDVFVLDGSENRIDIRDPTGAPAGSIGPVLPGGIELRSPEDIAVDGAGRLYVIDSRLAQIVVLE